MGLCCCWWPLSLFVPLHPAAPLGRPQGAGVVVAMAAERRGGRGGLGVPETWLLVPSVWSGKSRGHCGILAVLQRRPGWRVGKIRRAAEVQRGSTNRYLFRCRHRQRGESQGPPQCMAMHGLDMLRMQVLANPAKYEGMHYQSNSTRGTSAPCLRVSILGQATNLHSCAPEPGLVVQTNPAGQFTYVKVHGMARALGMPSLE